MTTRRKSVLLLTVSGLAGIGFFLSWEDGPVRLAPSRTHGHQETTAGNNSTQDPALPAAGRELGKEASGDWGIKEGSSWLARRNRDAASLLTAWEITGKDAWLREAAGRFPGNPMVCQAMMEHLGQKEYERILSFETDWGEDGQLKVKLEKLLAERSRWVERFIAAAPENPLGYYHRAVLLHQEKATGSAIASLHEALGRSGRPDDYLRERMLALKEGMTRSGATERDACLMWLNKIVDAPKPGSLSSTVGRLKSYFDDEFHESPNRQQFAELGLQVMEQTRFALAPSLQMEFDWEYGKRVCLSRLDPETEIGDTERSAVEELARWEGERAGFNQSFQGHSRLMAEEAAALPDEVVICYTEVESLEGTVAAIRYLISRPQKDAR